MTSKSVEIYPENLVLTLYLSHEFFSNLIFIKLGEKY